MARDRKMSVFIFFLTSSPAILENGIIRPLCIELNHLTKLCEKIVGSLGLPMTGVWTGRLAGTLYTASVPVWFYSVNEKH